MAVFSTLGAVRPSHDRKACLTVAMTPATVPAREIERRLLGRPPCLRSSYLIACGVDAKHRREEEDDVSCGMMHAAWPA